MISNWIKMVCLFFLMAVLVMPLNVFSQKAAPAEPEKKVEKKETEEKAPRDAYTEAERPDENYLARFDAIQISEKLIKENLDNIYMLKVIVSNFKDQGWEKEYKKIYLNYKNAVSLFYRRIVVYSRVELEKNRSDISNLCRKMVKFYKKEALGMLKECADKILDFSLEERNKFDPNKNRVLNKNMMRLWIAYGQLDDSERAYIDGIYKSSIFHLRIAKTYAITILEQLDPEKSKGRFDVQKADNRNRVLSPEGDVESKKEQPKT